MTSCQAIDVLSIPSTYVKKIRHAPSLDEACARRDALLPDLRRLWHVLGAEHHPDRGGDPAKFRRVKEAWEYVQSIHFVAGLWKSPLPQPEEPATIEVSGAYEMRDPAFTRRM